MRIKTLAGSLALACAAQAVPAATGAPDVSLYRLKLDAPQLVLRTEDGTDYRLDRKYRPPEPSASPSGVAAAAMPEPPPLSGKLSDQPFSKEIAKAAAAATVDPVLVHAIIFVESRYHPAAVSLKGAVGLMQVLPDTAARYGIRNPRTSLQANLRAGTLYLRDLLLTFDNRLDLALAAYNAGEGAVQHHRIPPYPETRQYVQAVLAKYNEWRNAATIEERRARIAQERNTEPPVPAKKLAEKQPYTEYLAGTRLAYLPNDSND